MRKTNIEYVMTLLASGGLGGLIIMIAIFMSVSSGDSTPKFTISYFFLYIIVFAAISSISCTFIFLFVSDSIWSRSVKKLRGTFAERNLSPTVTFESKNGMFYIDAINGKIATITKLNPFVLQIVDATAAKNPRVDNGSSMSPLGGTAMVSFCFTIDGKRWKIPTFTSNRAYSLKSDMVLTALSKADMQVALIIEAQQRAEKAG